MSDYRQTAIAWGKAVRCAREAEGEQEITGSMNNAPRGFSLPTDETERPEFYIG